MSQQPNFNSPMDEPFKPGPAGKATGTSGKAIASLVLGLLSFVGMCLTGIPGLILGIIGLSDVNKSAGRLGGKGLAIAGIVLSTIGIFWTIGAILVGMLLPAVSQVREAARRVTSANNMRQQALSMHNYHSAYGALPTQEKNGLSWRVHILPFLEQQELYSRFNLEEPWDSPNNIQLIPEMPEFFACPGVELPPGLTIYQVPFSNTDFLQEESLSVFDNSGKAISFAQITDGTSNTIMILEVDASAAVEWTKPDDWDFDPANPMLNVGTAFPGGFNVAIADGATVFVPSSIPPEEFKALITRAGGEAARMPY